MGILDFYHGRRVLITGHTGFKGTWLCNVLSRFGAEVVGYALRPQTEPNLFDISHTVDLIKNYYGDIRDYSGLAGVFEKEQPEVVFHLAAQPIVRESYRDPRYTYETNVMGTVNVLECIRHCESAKSVVNITTDKVYRNNEWVWGYRENDELDGFDPYSNSKSCSELVTHSYINSFFREKGVPVSTARAGNVIGGGDFAKDRIIPDCIRAVSNGRCIEVRNPYSTRPYQHVLEPLAAYLMIAEKQYSNPSIAGGYNVGPNETDCLTTGELVDLFVKSWGEDACWINKAESNAPHEANFLKLDCSKVKKTIGWKPKWNICESVEKTVEFSKVMLANGNISDEINREIEVYFNEQMGQ